MRRLLAIFWLIALMSDVSAQEFELPILRGATPYIPEPPVYFRWSGFYGGAQAGYTSGSVSFGDGVGKLIANAIRFTKVEAEARPETWPSIPSAYSKGANGGAFIGYNSQWDDIILGVELNYSHSGFTGTGTDSVGRRVQLSDNFLYDVTVTGTESVKLHDLFTGRVRGGYTMGQFMPYFTFGFAVGVLDYTKTGAVSWPQPVYALTPPPPPPPSPPGPFSNAVTDAKQNQIGLGYSVGAGLDVLILPHVFVRGEYEFVGLPIARMNLLMHNFRLAAGLKL